MHNAQDYSRGFRNDIVQWASSKAAENLPPPELKQVTSDESVQDACAEKQLCILTFLPQLLDCQSECRNKYLNLLKELIAKYKKSPWGYVVSSLNDSYDMALDGSGPRRLRNPNWRRRSASAASAIRPWWRSTRAR